MVTIQIFEIKIKKFKKDTDNNYNDDRRGPILKMLIKIK
jgi:hypothetical protein